MLALRHTTTIAPNCRDRCAPRRIENSLSRLLICWLALVAFRQSASAQDMIDSRLEYNVKAVSLYAFGRYVTWPPSAFENDGSPFVIGIFRDNPFGDALERIAKKKTLNGRAITVRQIDRPDDCANCHIVFVPRSISQSTEEQVFEQVAGKPVLLVGESPGFATRGGVINFYHSGSNVRFELNPEKGEENNLSLNAKLLTLGTKASTRR
jgi:hypothetical protein